MLQLSIDPRTAIRINQLKGHVSSLGRTTFTTTVNQKELSLSAHVLDGFSIPLLIGLDAGEQLNLIVSMRDRKAFANTRTSITQIAASGSPSRESHLAVSGPPTGDHEPLTPAQQAQVDSLLDRFSDVFATEQDEVGRIPGITHHIELRTAKPIYTKARRRPQHVNDTIREIVRDLLKRGYIRKSKSPYSSQALLAHKTNGDPRLVIDYRPLNNETVDDKHPMPHIRSVIDRTRGSRFFTSLDIAWGYWHVALDPQSVSCTAFSTEDGHFEWLVMPFGLKNAPATYQRAIRLILGESAFKFAMNYLDDILLYDSRFADHLQHIEEILIKLRAFNIKLRRPKCRFASPEAEYLGMVICNDTVRPKESYLEAVSRFAEPKSKKEIQRFLGLCNWVREFIYGFTELAAPLTAMTGARSANRPLQPVERQAFNALKQALLSAPVLTIFDPEKEVELHCDASDIGIGAILAQRSATREPQVVAYHSRKLSDQQQRWPTQDKEGYAVVDSIKQFDPYLSRPFKVFTDHSSLQWLQCKEQLPARIHRWFIRISPYSFTIHHKKGTLNQAADALSRAPVLEPNKDEYLQRGTIVDMRSADRGPGLSEPEPSTEPQTMLSITNPLSPDLIKEVQQQADLSAVRRPITINGLIHAEINGCARVVLPEPLIVTALNFYHDLHGHPGRSKTSRLVSLFYWWPSITHDIDRYVKSCDRCQRIKAAPGPRLGELQLMPCPQEPMELLAMDTIVVGSSANSTAAKYVQVVIDHMSRFVWATATKTNTAAAAITALDRALRTANRSSSLLTDNGTNFTSKAFRKFLDSKDISHRRSTAYHPETNGMVERVNGSLTVRIRLKLDEFPKRKWSSLLQQVVDEYNATPHETTGFTPNYLLLGILPDGPRPADLPPLEEARQISAQRTRAQQLKNKEAFDAKHRSTFLEIGQRVVRRVPANHPDLKKFSPRNCGPFFVLAKIGPVTYSLGRSADDASPFAAHVSQLKVYVDRDDNRVNSIEIEGGECDGSAVARPLTPDSRTADREPPVASQATPSRGS